LTADFFDSVHPLPEVCISASTFLSNFAWFNSRYSLPLHSADLSICRVTNSLFLVLLFQRQGPYRLILSLLHLKPPRLTKVRTEMMSKNWKMRLARRHRFLPHLLKRLVRQEKKACRRNRFLELCGGW
jgi:hypothetical protein